MANRTGSESWDGLPVPEESTDDRPSVTVLGKTDSQNHHRRRWCRYPTPLQVRQYQADREVCR